MKKNKELGKIIKQTMELIKEQINGVMGSPNWKERFGGSEFTLGYIFGHSLILIGSKTKDENERALGVGKEFNKFLIKAKNV